MERDVGVVKEVGDGKLSGKDEPEGTDSEGTDEFDVVGELGPIPEKIPGREVECRRVVWT
jgi:hypothetical protein